MGGVGAAPELAGGDLESFDELDFDEPAAPPPPMTPAAAPPAPEPPGAPPPPSAGDGAEPAGDTGTKRREAWPLLDAQDEVAPGTPFAVQAGLSRSRVEGVSGTGRMLVPAEPFVLDLEVVVHGFTVIGPARRSLPVTPEDPYPSVDFMLEAHDDPDLKRVREIGCTFVVGGTLCGYASRLVEVVPSTEEAHGIEQPPGAPAELGLDTNAPEEAADLTIVITAGDDRAESKLLWRLYSPHLAPPADLDPVDIGSSPQDFAANIINTGNLAANDPQGIFDHLVGSGLQLADHMPGEVRRTIADVTAHVGDRVPALLIATADPYLPWELAVLDRELQFDHPDESPFLGAQTAIGRWPLTGRQPPSKPVTSVTVKDRAVVAGSYVKVQGVPQLEAAEAEAAELLSTWPGAQAVEPAYPIVRQLLRGSPPADLLHFALHGQFQESVRNGLVLIATDDNGMQTPYYLQPSQIESGRLARRPFVFLNACQVAAGTRVLGDHAGLAAALLKIGAASVVAPLWSIDDAVAHSIATGFYAATVEAPAGESVPVAEILRQGRARFTPAQIDAGEGAGASTHLAFQFFGHPRLTLQRAAT